MKKDLAIFLFSESDTIALPWSENGIECHLFDVKLINGCKENIFYHGGLIQSNRKLLGKLCRENNVLLLGSFSPCDDVALCGSKHFEKKALNDAMFWAKSMELFYHGLFLADYFNIPFFSENPKSMITTLYEKPDYKFHPYEYGGYLRKNQKHRYYPEIYPEMDAYKKETWLWCGNGFVMPIKKPVQPVSDNYPGWRLLGGKSERTKKIRSVTPEGFARAVFEANYLVPNLHCFREAG